MQGEQWICKCQTRNMFLRKRCRECGSPESEKIGFESAMEILERYQRNENKEVVKT